MAKKPREIRWSYSQLTMYERCPLQWRFAYLDRLPRAAPSIYMERGNAMHAACEDFLKKPRARKVPPALVEQLGPRLLAAKSAGALAELEVCVDRQWRYVGKDGCWGLARVDVHWVEARADRVPGLKLQVRDLKSGRVRDYTDQVRVYLAMLINRYPAATIGEGDIWYADQPQRAGGRPVTLGRQQILGVQRELTARVKRLENDHVLRATPSESACRWCDFSKHRGGPCTRG